MRTIRTVFVCLLFCSLIARAQSNQQEPSRAQILEYVRELMAFSPQTALEAGPIHASRLPGYYETRITAGTGAHSKTWNVALSANQDFLIVGNLVEATPNFQKTAVPEVKQSFQIPSGTDLSIGYPESSIYSAFYKVPVEIGSQPQQQSIDIFLTKDRRTLVAGIVFPILARPRPEILNSISLTDAAAQGEKDAPITIIEYADLQCPACARMHEFMEKDLIPRYRGKVRVIFKEFPLVPLHNWAWTAAVASKCVHEIDPKQFVDFRSSVFQRQLEITAADARKTLLQIGTSLGVDLPNLSACVDNQITKSLVDQDVREGKLLEISTTPTLVINGRIVVGMPEKDYFYKIVDDALSQRGDRLGVASGAGCACDENIGILGTAPPSRATHP
jgi:protein-disulfide isomerase